MFPPKKILFPVDFCEQCIGASRSVEAMTGRLEAELVLLHVLVSPGYYGLPEPLAAAETQLAAFQRDEFRYFRVRRMVEKADDATEKILAVSRTENVDLIMMPTSGIGRYRRFILGSATAKVLHDADWPLWTGVHLEQAPPLEALRIQNVVCAVDLKPHSERVLAWVQQISSEYQAALHVVHATSAHETRPARYFDAELARHLEMEGKEAIQEFLNARRVEAAIRGAGGIDGTIQVPPAPTLANVVFVDPPGAVGWFQFPPASLVQYGCVALHPAPNRCVVCRKTSFHEQFLDIPIRKREPQIPTDRTNNDLGFEVPPFEQRWPRFDHGISCSLSDPFTEFLQHRQIFDHCVCSFGARRNRTLLSR